MRTFFAFLLLYLASVAGTMLAFLLALRSLTGPNVTSPASGTLNWPGLLLLVCYGTSWVALVGMAWVALSAFLRKVLRVPLPHLWPTILKYTGISRGTPTGRWQFGIFTLLLVTLLASILLSSYAVKRKSTRDQQAALDALGSFVSQSEWSFGNVSFLNLANGNREIDDSVIPLLASFKQLEMLTLQGKGITGDGLAELPSRKLESLDLFHTSVPDSALPQLADIPKLKSLDLTGSLVTDAGMPCLLSLTKLEYLRLDRTTLTDEGLRILAKHPNLKKLHLSHTRITDEGLEHLATLNCLEVLTLNATMVTDEGLRHLAKLNLTELKLSDTVLSGEGLAALRTLTSLDLTNTRTNDAGLREIASLKGLHVLALEGTGISDSGLEHLHGLQNLWLVDIENTKVSPSAVEKLRRALPQGAMLEAPPNPLGQALQRPSVEVGGTAGSLE